ncbi:kinase-like domain-containing protein [Jimgerdemannia flammicorona]|uniref:Kinase-like domain-containing protein n=1 Tax=Jimgerdemannia flammicorona TaxID=994334 RepID=A0A433D2A8_9FUNG|nr:kinase-like domain-containing protein [Jimgerdemannia flammicorona]
MEQTRTLGMIQNDDVAIVPLNWDHVERWGEQLSMKSYTCNLRRSLDSIIQAPLADLLTSNIQAFIRSDPFASGGLRYALPLYQPSDERKLVAKMFKDGPLTKDRYLEVMAIQAIATKLVYEFNRYNPPQTIDFIDVRVVEIEQTHPSEDTYFTVEPYIEGDYVKHNNNAGWSNELMATAQAYSHFTWQKSGNKLIVVDLQGVAYIMTDPVIHSVNPPHSFGSTDFGREGVDSFFSTHRCNYVCDMLNLTRHPMQPRDPISTITNQLQQANEQSGPRQVNCNAAGCSALVEIGQGGVLGAAATMSDIYCNSCKRRMRLNQTFTCNMSGCKIKFSITPYRYTARGEDPPTRCPAHRNPNVPTPGGPGRSRNPGRRP